MNGAYRQRRVPCEVCAGRRFRMLQAVGRIGSPGEYGPLPVQACVRCGLVMVNPRYERRFYRDYYRTCYRRVATGSPVPTVEYLRRQVQRGERIRRFVQPFLPGAGKMLDIGCSAGATMIPFQRNGWSCVGVDPDAGSVRAGRHRLGVDVRVGDAEGLSFPKGEFTLALGLGTFEHVYDLAGALRRCRACLRPEGLLLLRTRSHRLWGSPLEYFNHNHYRYFSQRTLRLALLRYGFHTVQVSTEPLEGIPGTYYTLARAVHPVPLARLRRMIAAGMGDDATVLAQRLLSYGRGYRRRARRFLALVDSCGAEPRRVARAVRAERNPFTLLDGPVDEAVRRAELEARLFLARAREPDR